MDNINNNSFFLIFDLDIFHIFDYLTSSVVLTTLRTALRVFKPLSVVLMLNDLIISLLTCTASSLVKEATRIAAFMKAFADVSSAVNWAEGVWLISSDCPPIGRATTGTPISNASYTA